MAIYHCGVKIIGRNAGRSSVAAAAYRAGERLINEYDGVEHDFTNKGWVEYTEIILPDNAPREYADRNTLWNAVEMAEKSKDAQLCREFELALPRELNRAQQIEIVQQFVRDKLTSQGMVADIAIHNPPKTNDRHQPIDVNGKVTKDVSEMQFINPHAHILVTVRPMNEEGIWEPKTEKEYICIKDNEERGFTASEFRQVKEEGWQKQYQYYYEGKKIWLTAEEGELRELNRVNRSPKSSRYGRRNAITEYWNSKDRIFEWRQYWEKVVNDKFASIKSDIRIDSRSFRDQGRDDEIPTIHMGPSATNMEKRAERELREGKSESQVTYSDIGNINRQIQEHNKFVRELKAHIDEMVKMAKDFITEVAKRLEGIRARLIGNKYEEAVLSYEHRVLSSKIIPEGQRINRYEKELLKVTEANNRSEDVIKRLKGELKACNPLQVSKKKELQSRLKEEQAKVEARKEYMNSISKMCSIPSEKALERQKREIGKERGEHEKLGDALKGLEKNTEELVKAYKGEFEKIEQSDMDELLSKSINARKEMEDVVRNELVDKYGQNFDTEVYEDAKDKVDKCLAEALQGKGRKAGKGKEKGRERNHVRMRR